MTSHANRGPSISIDFLQLGPETNHGRGLESPALRCSTRRHEAVAQLCVAADCRGPQLYLFDIYSPPSIHEGPFQSQSPMSFNHPRPSGWTTVVHSPALGRKHPSVVSCEQHDSIRKGHSGTRKHGVVDDRMQRIGLRLDDSCYTCIPRSTHVHARETAEANFDKHNLLCGRLVSFVELP